MKKKFRTPQEKKILSYEKDCRNIYGENDKQARKAIPFRKRWVNQTYRNEVRQNIFIFDLSNEFAAEYVEDGVKSVKRKSWKKYSDRNLGIYLRWKDKNNKSKLIKFIKKSNYLYDDYYISYK